MSLRDEILAVDDIEKREITVKRWNNKKVLIKSFNAGERYKVIDKATDEKTGKVDTTKLTLLMVIASVYDPKTNERLFKDGDYAALEKKSSEVIEVISDVIRDINGIGEEQMKATEKN